MKKLLLALLLCLTMPLQAQLLVRGFTTSNYVENTVGAPMGNWSSTGANAMISTTACLYSGTYAISTMAGCCYNYYIGGSENMSGTAYAVGGYYNVADTSSRNCLITWAAEGGPNTNGIYVETGGNVKYVYSNSLTASSSVTISAGQCYYIGMATDGVNIYGWVFNAGLVAQPPTDTFAYTGLSGYVNRITFHNTVNSSDNSYMRATLNDLVMYNNYVSYAPFDGATPTPTPTTTPTKTMTPTATLTPTETKTFTSSPTISPVYTLTKTISLTLTPTRTKTPTASPTSTPTATRTASKTATPGATKTITATRTVTRTPSITKTPTRTASPTRTPSTSPTPTRTQTPGGAGGYVVTEHVTGTGATGAVQTVNLSRLPLCLIQVYWNNTTAVTSGSATFVPLTYFSTSGCTIANTGTVNVGASATDGDNIEFYVTYCY